MIRRYSSANCRKLGVVGQVSQSENFGSPGSGGHSVGFEIRSGVGHCGPFTPFGDVRLDPAAVSG